MFSLDNSTDNASFTNFLVFIYSVSLAWRSIYKEFPFPCTKSTEYRHLSVANCAGYAPTTSNKHQTNWRYFTWHVTNNYFIFLTAATAYKSCRLPVSHMHRSTSPSSASHVCWYSWYPHIIASTVNSWWAMWVYHVRNNVTLSPSGVILAAAQLPKYYHPNASLSFIRQELTPPKFCAIRYILLDC